MGVEGGQSMVLKEGGGMPKVANRKEVVVIDVDDKGKITRTVEVDEDEDQHVGNYMPVMAGQSNEDKMIEYRSSQEDMDWACSGLVAMVGTGEMLLSIHQRVEDVGFDNVKVIPLGGDKAFLHYRNNGDIMKIFNEAVDFFSKFFTDVHKWTSMDVQYERGAWIRIYGMSVHAWNSNFFKLYVSEYGRFVQADECTMDRGIIDFARILISTTSLEVMNNTTVLMVDGWKYTIKLVEEWGCNLGEDTFLTEEVVDHRVASIDGDT